MGRFDSRATSPRRGFSDVLRWKLVEPFRGARPAPPLETPFATPRRDPDRDLILSGEPSLTWIGHASFLLSLGGLRILLDPVFAPRVGPVPRLAPPGLALADLPDIDVVIISHNHRDHLDAWTIKRIGPKPTYIVPLGNANLIRKCGGNTIIELDWWETTSVGRTEITIVPSRHWSMHLPWDRNEALWGGCVIRAPEGTAYHSGDTAFFDGFQEIGERAGPIDWAMLPIGAYEPRWFMEPQHMCPEEAVLAAMALKARRLVAMHWGTFRLTDEPIHEPPERARASYLEKMGEGGEEGLWILDIGETRRL
jgi:L-ascorbate metabolism protein UlaG (beta-lactamase superfamily)